MFLCRFCDVYSDLRRRRRVCTYARPFFFNIFFVFFLWLVVACCCCYYCSLTFVFFGAGFLLLPLALSVPQDIGRARNGEGRRWRGRGKAGKERLWGGKPRWIEGIIYACSGMCRLSTQQEVVRSFYLGSLDLVVPPALAYIPGTRGRFP